jgi:hypothetical protein
LENKHGISLIHSLLARDGVYQRTLSCTSSLPHIRIDESKKPKISARKTSLTAMTDFMYQGTSEIERINAHPAEQCRAIWWQMDRSTGLSQKCRFFQNLEWRSA